jgi:hypothetical protein
MLTLKRNAATLRGSDGGFQDAVDEMKEAANLRRPLRGGNSPDSQRAEGSVFDNVRSTLASASDIDNRPRD